MELVSADVVRGKRWVLFPIHGGSHYTLTAYDVSTGNVYYLDSMSRGCTVDRRAMKVLTYMQKALDRQDGMSLLVPHVPQQYHGDGCGADCGAFVCSWLLRYGRGEEGSEFRILQEDMVEYRLHIAVSVCLNKLTL